MALTDVLNDLSDARSSLVTAINGRGGSLASDATLRQCATALAGYANALKGVIERTATVVILPEGLTSIGADAFHGCTSLTSVTIPGTVTAIDSTAFSDCTSLTDIYCGFAEGAVSGAPWGATNATIHYDA